MTLFTVGHSNVAIDRFLPLLTRRAIDVLVDARSRPFSRYSPQFNREALRTSLQQAGIAYLYLGDRLGGRPADAKFYRTDGTIDYDRLAQEAVYREGLQRLKQEAGASRVAIMCSEADYRTCHRYWLITRSLVAEGVEVQHLLHSVELVHTHADAFTPADDQLLLW